MKTMAAVQPMAPKKGYTRVSIVILMVTLGGLVWVGAWHDGGRVGREVGIDEAGVLTA